MRSRLILSAARTIFFCRTDLTPKTNYFAYFEHRAKATALRMHYLGSWQQRIIEFVTRDRSRDVPSPSSTPSASSTSPPPAAVRTSAPPLRPLQPALGSSVCVVEPGTGAASRMVVVVSGVGAPVRSESRCWGMFAVAKMLGLEKRRVQRNVKAKSRESKSRAAALKRYLRARRVMKSIEHAKHAAKRKRAEKKAQKVPKRGSEGKEMKGRARKRGGGGEGEEKRGGRKRARGGGGSGGLGDGLYSKDRLAAEEEGGGGGSKGSKGSRGRWRCDVCGEELAVGSKYYHLKQSKKHKERAGRVASRSQPD